MKDNKPHYQVQFASRYGGGSFRTLNAASAIWRAQMLVDDAESLINLATDADTKNLIFGARLGTYEIVSYFSVGLVTCLEWHARSRLADLMVFQPSAIQVSDLKNIASVALSQMVSEGATIPHLLAATTHVSSIQEYISTFRRLFEELKIDFNVEKSLRNTQTNIETYESNSDTSLYGIIENLFRYRNQLVHEIDLSVIGHFSLRGTWRLKQAQQHGEAVISCIRMIEKRITEGASQSFPNRLDEEGYAEDELMKLANEVAAIEDEISPQIEKWGTIDGTESSWPRLLKEGREFRDRELAFLNNANFLRPIRHLDWRRTIQIEYLRNRLAFLSVLRDQIHE